MWIASAFLFRIRGSLGLWASFLILSVCLIAALTGVIVFAYAMIRTRNQASAILPVIIILLSMLGGSMISLNVMPPFMKKIAIISPVYWGVDGLQRLFIANESIVHLMTHLAVLLTIAMVLNVVSIAVFTRKIRS
jgi:ABC-2 type transport system permease protein